MQAVIQSLEHMVLALAVAAFAHFGVALKEAPCPKATPAVQRVSYAHPNDRRTIRRAPAQLAKDARPV
jgi:hypothetical protein